MNILGVHIGHDSSAALIVDGQIVADVAEERFSRIKHDAGLPIKAIDYCLNFAGISIKDIDIIAVPSNKSLPLLNFLFDLKGKQKEQQTNKRRVLEFAKGIMNKGGMKPPLYIKNFPVSSKQEIFHVEHHLAHAASAYYTSGTREKQLIFTIDGAGDDYSVAIWRGENSKIEPIKKFSTNASIGWFYSNVTEALGWWHGDGEGKTMGLAPYGDFNKVRGKLEDFYPVFSNGELIKEYDFGRSYVWNQHGALQFHFDDSYKIKKLIENYGRENIAAEAQRILEEQVFEIIFPWIEKEKIKKISCAGGVFLNVKLNQRLWETGKLEMQHIYPNAGDSGLAVGAALYAYYKHNPNKEINKIKHLYLGPEYSSEEIKKILDMRNLKYKYINDIEKYAAEQLANNKIIAWFQGRMESGPRALGNRSILMSPNRAENKDIINARVKFREAFRPFCPSLLNEKKNDYLENSRDEDYMITSFSCIEEKRKKIPAVVHADSTLRPQTVKKEVNKRYWKIINEFGKITGEYILLNTSFNIMGEPIINNPREAIRSFYDNGIDVLVMNNYVLEK